MRPVSFGNQVYNLVSLNETLSFKGNESPAKTIAHVFARHLITATAMTILAPAGVLYNGTKAVQMLTKKDYSTAKVYARAMTMDLVHTAHAALRLYFMANVIVKPFTSTALIVCEILFTANRLRKTHPLLTLQPCTLEYTSLRERWINAI
jgi:hypothetical protein